MTQPWNTPIGTTNEQINGPEMVECDVCDGEGRVCDLFHDHNLNNLDCATAICPTCNGTGQVPKKSVEENLKGK